MHIGAHVPTAGGPAKAVERGAEAGADSIQIFNQSPRMWKGRDYTADEVAAFHEAARAPQDGPGPDPRRLPAQLRLRGQGAARQVARRR